MRLLLCKSIWHSIQMWNIMKLSILVRAKSVWRATKPCLGRIFIRMKKCIHDNTKPDVKKHNGVFNLIVLLFNS